LYHYYVVIGNIRLGLLTQKRPAVALAFKTIPKNAQLLDSVRRQREQSFILSVLPSLKMETF
jgi:hypothetical protein